MITVEHTPIADVMASMIHDIKNTLFWASTRLTAPLSENDSRDVRSSIFRAAERMDSLLTAYRLLRHESAESLINIAPVFIDQLVEEAIAQAQSSNEQIKIVSRASYTGVWLLSRDLVQDVLVNLIENAIRYAKTTVIVRTAINRDGGLEINVTDDGAGFAPENIGKKGVGIYIAHRVMALHRSNEKHGALLLSHSEQTGGASVTMKFPSAWKESLASAREEACHG